MSLTMRSRQPLAWVVLLVPLGVVVLYLIASLSAHAARGGGRGGPPPAADDDAALLYAAALQASPADANASSGAGTPVAQVLTPTAGGDIRPNPTHIVRAGDTLSRLATQYGVAVNDIAAASNLSDLNRLQLGQMLVIPLFGMTPTPPAATVAVTPLALLTNSPTPAPPSATATPSPAPTETPAASATAALPAGATPTRALLLPEQPTADPIILVGTDTADQLLTAVPPLPTAVSLAPIGRSEINGVPENQFIVMDEITRLHVRQIFALGQELGRNPRAFSKVGDSTIENPFFMDRFDEPGTYNLADYAWLQPAIDWYRGSFNRQSLAVAVGLHTWSVLDPMWADPYRCLGGENMLECEVRVHNPSVIIFRLGVNDVGVPGYVERSMRTAIEFSLENGIIPIIGTKGDRREGTVNNDIMRRLAAEYRVPLWDYDVLAGTIPGRGLVSDGAHMTTFYAHDWSLPQAFQTGHGVHTLAGLMMLDAIHREVLADRVMLAPEATPEATAEAPAS
jgi:LysM repeat protein